MNTESAQAGFVLDPILPLPVVAVIAALLAAVTVHVYWRTGRVIARKQNLLLLLFRLFGLVLVMGLLLQPSEREMLPPPSREQVTVVALDSSASMKQRDVGRATRFDAARDILRESGAVLADGSPANPRVRLFQFHADAQPVTQSIQDVVPRGNSTRIHTSVNTLLNTAAAGEAIHAVILLTDGHDFELVNPVKTGAAARARQVPIYAVAMGKQGRVRDVSVRITSFQPYSYVKQKTRVAASLRLIGCEFETIQVQLLRHGQVAQTRRVNADELQEAPVEFEVIEPEVGQYEYEVRVLPLEGEVDNANNSAITYLNVIDQQIRVLVLEGDPYWDTTFLQRSLMRNDKFEVDSLVRYGPDRVRPIRKTATAGELRLPTTLEQFGAYDVIILGRAVDDLLNPAQIALLDQYVKERSGAVIFSRGRAFTKAAAGELEPVIWTEAGRDRVRVDATSEGRGLAAFRTLSEHDGGMDALPELINARAAETTKPLTATLAQGTDRDTGATVPAIVHRRYGRGQVISVGVEGMWRWGLNAKLAGDNLPFDRFWDQLILWLLAGRDFIPNRQFSFRPNSANIQLGEKVYFRLTMRQPDSRVTSVPLTLFFEDKEIGRVSLTTSATDGGRLAGEYLPERVGRYRAVARFPDGTQQDARFIVFNENLEETEVTTDIVGLRRLCESSGGRVIEPPDLKRLLEELSDEKTEAAPKTRLRPVWNAAWVFYTIGLLFGLDWFLRRRWGLC
ncbi:MAG TPA: VWA domain-containing protein [Verrucomicrobiae bacterium]|nr:VWA domain-containing protein [Verrucomicrobiae bacterium]